jgi:dTDP-glucose 4,6-dehydratase
MRSLLVTGGAGFIGANFVRYWLDEHPGDALVVLDALTYAGNQASLAGLDKLPNYSFIRGDIGDEALVSDLLARHRVNTLVHFAAETHVDRSISGPDEFVRSNVLGTHVLLKCARRTWHDGSTWQAGVRFHHVSTDEVYGSLETGEPPFTEQSQYIPSSPYSASKAASDHLVRAYHHTYGMPVTTSHCSNNYGPFQFPEKLIPLMLVNALDGKPLPVYGQGGNVRDWLFVLDHCRALSLIIEQGRIGERYNIGGNNEWRNIDIVNHLCTLLDGHFRADPQLAERFPRCPASRGGKVDSLITFVTDRAGHDWRYALDTTRIRDQLGFRPTETFASGIATTVRWYLDNEPWWRSVLDGSYRRAAG